MSQWRAGHAGGGRADERDADLKSPEKPEKPRIFGEIKCNIFFLIC